MNDLRFLQFSRSLAQLLAAGRRRPLVALALALPLLVLALSPAAARMDERAGGPNIITIASNVDEPTSITHAGDGSGRIFITLRDGDIRIWDGVQLLPTPFLDIDPLVGSNNSEQGLLSVAFHPDYETNGYFYVNYTDTNGGDTVVARYSVSAGDPNVADPNSALIYFEIDQPYVNHNGGQLQFGPDGYLYIGMGDGGSAGDPQNRAQNMGVLLGKMLRIDVNDVVGNQPDCGGGSNYTIPADNPFNDGPGGDCDEIYMLGLRNPWRFSFDSATGDLYIGDVGQDTWEEVDRQPASSTGGENWGWRCYEGNHAYNTTGCGPQTDYDAPIVEYQHASGRCSITGGYVYHGSALPQYNGAYWYADYCSGEIFVAIFQGGQWRTRRLVNTNFLITTFGEDQDGEICFNDYSATGEVYCIYP